MTASAYFVQVGTKYGSSRSTVPDLFGVSISAAIQAFNKVICLLVVKIFDAYVRLPIIEDESETELPGFIENYEFPCVRPWDGFHVCVSSKLMFYLRCRNLKYVIMAWVKLHTLSIVHSNPCEPRHRLEIKQLNLIRKNTTVSMKVKIIPI